MKYAWPFSGSYKDTIAGKPIRMPKAIRRRKPRAPRPSYKERKAVSQTTVAGVKLSRVTTLKYALMQDARSRGGLAAAAKQASHRWTSEEAREAALKSWRKRGRLRGRSGTQDPPIRLGRRVAKAKPIDRAYLRAWHTVYCIKGIYFDAMVKQWYRKIPALHVISERHALRTLGYLRQKTQMIPETFREVTTGKRRAETTR